VLGIQKFTNDLLIDRSFRATDQAVGAVRRFVAQRDLDVDGVFSTVRRVGCLILVGRLRVAQAEQRRGEATWIGRASIIHERQQLLATQAAGGADYVDQRLTTSRASVAYLPNQKYSYTVGYFQTTGTADSTLYPPQDFLGSRTGQPNTSGGLDEIAYNPWQNVRVGAQYLAYNRFNGVTTAYDVVGGAQCFQQQHVLPVLVAGLLGGRQPPTNRRDHTHST
jgi:hypothetical protein